jgi:hypothetical protein
MDRLVNQDGANFQAGVVTLDLVFTAAAAGAVPATFTYADGVLSVTKSSADYLVVLQDYYYALLGECTIVLQAAYSATTGACEGKVTAEAVATAGTLTLSFFNAAGTAVALSTGDVLRCTLRLQRWGTY